MKVRDTRFPRREFPCVVRLSSHSRSIPSFARDFTANKNIIRWSFPPLSGHPSWLARLLGLSSLRPLFNIQNPSVLLFPSLFWPFSTSIPAIQIASMFIRHALFPRHPYPPPSPPALPNEFSQRSKTRTGFVPIYISCFMICRMYFFLSRYPI